MGHLEDQTDGHQKSESPTGRLGWEGPEDREGDSPKETGDSAESRGRIQSKVKREKKLQGAVAQLGQRHLMGTAGGS